MSIEVKLNSLPESVEEATLMTWYKNEGEPVERDEKIADIETDKVVLEVAAQEAGILTKINKKQGDTLVQGEVLGMIDPQGEAISKKDSHVKSKAEIAPIPEKISPKSIEEKFPQNDSREKPETLSPAAKKLAEEHGLDLSSIEGTGKDGRITKADITGHIASSSSMSPVPQSSLSPQPPEPSVHTIMPFDIPGDRPDKRLPMTRLRARVAERLVQVQQTAALLTTFNEVNMQPVIELRKRYRDVFEKAHGVKLGFMSFFVKATVEALKQFPVINASIDGQDIVYHGYYDIGIAVSPPRGLVVPVLRNVDQLTYAEIEQHIKTFGHRAKEGQLTIEELTGGTFTITNGGIFGSFLSTPILNPPQSGILGMHKIEERPVAENGEVVIRPIMYLALSYDHRLVDGREAVSFLVMIKERLEDPSRMLLNI
ncbi:MAG: 2-oxoglutarate dehydrogenase complex dihydrolipoyllysine-residue succinyltransferase [Kiritimatiellae bacterium]|nr:2-oxoglutarate dehydrogenase complex dihydrolipoyllysine-residue succinyltransferase [Kiritimatiellia bacterium]